MPAPGSGTPAIDRLMLKRSIGEGDCWVYTGAITDRGYGLIWGAGRHRQVHRVAYEHFVGPVPEGLHLDHLCRNRSCFNPDHLEPVTPRENLLRGQTLAAANADKTRCKRDHEFTAANTYTDRRGSRHCRSCAADRKAEYRRRAAA